MATTTVHATGLTCHHCAASVTEELEEIGNVTAVDVRVVPEGESIVTIAHDGELDPAKVAEAVQEAGYRLAP